NVDVAQRDLLGSGSTLDLRAERNTERRTNAVEFLSPAALGAYWNLDALYARSSDGDEQKIALERPLYSHATPWTANVLFDHLTRNARIFSEGAVAARFRQRHRELAMSRSFGLHSGATGSSRLVAGIDFLDDAFAQLPEHPLDILPDARHFHFIDFGYE